jgi:hypothetical protein
MPSVYECSNITIFFSKKRCILMQNVALPVAVPGLCLVTHAPEAEALIHPKYRENWTL